MADWEHRMILCRFSIVRFIVKNVLFVNNTYPLFEKGDSGASNRSTMFIAALSTIGHVDVVSFVPDQLSNIDNCDVIYSKAVTSLTNTSRMIKLKRVLTPWRINSLYPLNTNKEAVVDSFINKKKYAFIAVRYINEASECGLWKYSNRLVLDIDDNPKKHLLNAARQARTLRNRAYTYLLAIEVGAIMKWVSRNALCCFYSNPKETPIKNAVYLHNVAICDKQVPDISEETPLRLLVIGTYHYAPNKNGVQHFLTHVFPIVRKAIPDIMLRIVGSIYDEDLKKEWGKEPNVQLVGYVKDLYNEYENVRLSIVPIYSGSGTSIKLIESIYMNRACVSTIQGVRGMEGVLEADCDYLYAENDMQFADIIIKAVRDVERCNTIAHNASRAINCHLSKTHFVTIVQNTLSIYDK